MNDRSTVRVAPYGVPAPSRGSQLSERVPDRDQLAEVARVASLLHGEIARVLEGKDDVVDNALVVFLADGHLLLEDVPGVGKTMLAKALARAVNAPMRRIQFTPDLLPSDITGISIFNQEQRGFEFRPGAIFASIVVCDEINRASPKTQSAVLESMEEGQVTVDGRTYGLPQPFLVIATQNPLEMEGTYPLPEAQRDRFMARLSMGYPDAAAEMALLDSHSSRHPLEDIRPVADADTVQRIISVVRGVHASAALRRYIVDLVAATRTSPALRLGASPRASLHLLRAARARAATHGRDHVLPDDIQALALPVLEHRLLPSAETQLARRSLRDVLTDIVHHVPIPSRPR